MNKKYNLLIVILGTLFLLAGWIMSYNERYMDISRVCTELGSISCLAVLISHNQFYKTIYWVISLGCLALILLGVFSGKMDWPGAEVLVITGFSGTIICYSWRFFKKTGKYHLDYLKWLWLLTQLPARLLVILHLPFAGELYFISFILFLALLLDYILFAKGEGFLSKQNDAAE